MHRYTQTICSIEAYCYVYTILHTGYGTTLVSRVPGLRRADAGLLQNASKEREKERERGQGITAGNPA